MKQNASVACFSPAQSTRSTLITRPAILARVCGGDSGPARGTSVPDVGNYRRDLSCRFLDISGGHNSGAGTQFLKIGCHSIPSENWGECVNFSARKSRKSVFVLIFENPKEIEV